MSQPCIRLNSKNISINSEQTVHSDKYIKLGEMIWQIPWTNRKARYWLDVK